MNTSYKRVINHHETDEDAVKDSETNKKPVEVSFHVFPWEDENGDNIANQSEQSNTQLKAHKYWREKIRE